MFYENKPDSFGIYDERIPLQYPLHLHQYIEIVHVLKGLLEMQIGSNKYLLQPGDAAIAFPNTAHDYHTLSGPEETHFLILNCYVDVIPMHKIFLNRQRPSNPVVSSKHVHPDILYTENRLLELRSTSDNSLLISSLCSLILSRLFPYLALEDIQSQPQDITSDVISYIAGHYLEDISLSSVASHFGIGKYSLSRLFSNVLGCHFISYINRLRISYSRTLLVNTDMNITRVAVESGFNNQQTFNRIFKSLEGCTPKEYRRNHTSVQPNPYFL